MNKLSVKIFIILLPLAISLLIFSYAYYNAREKLTIDHIYQSVQLSASLGANEISHYVEGRFTEFDRLSNEISTCKEGETSLSLSASDALSFTSGFSALAISDLSGQVTHFSLSSNKSNRYVLRKNIKGLILLPEHVLALLHTSYQEWQTTYPENLRLEKETLEQLLALNKRGEINSQASRNLSNLLVKIREGRSLPRQVISLASAETISKLGLIFDTASYFYSRPLIDCNQQIIGFYTAVLDRTIVEDHLYQIKNTLTQSGLEHVDVLMVRNQGLRSLSSVNHLPLDSLATTGLNPTNKPQMRNDLGGILINQPIVLHTQNHLISVNNHLPTVPNSQKGVSLIVFVSMDELKSRNLLLLREVLLYLMIALFLFVSLTLFLSSYIASPIVDLRRRISILSRTGKAKTDFSVRDDEIGQLFSAFSDMAYSIKTKESQLVKLVREDPLTGILNRRALVDHAEDISRHNAPSCICMMDLDHFKQINDSYGHAIGDSVLKTFCTLVTSELRESDIFGRLGGEEFALILPETQLEEAVNLAERIRSRVEIQLVASLSSIVSSQVTVSIGVVEWLDDDFDRALSRADKHLYMAKKEGRNQVKVQETISPH
ncbi:diguanylate cyclase [Vibrio sp. Isolate23]|uniref:GGDEF domain-containing protein n=1 Tax=Vibrio sp. Isolate23 TaxID=2908533 RepID=UPI001EFD468D|nr:diguanylate cyclase [Vibrio sp. Isolate23]MCG9681334.1 diguanylate cyclase [Vibrio sp. Isolate23]